MWTSTYVQSVFSDILVEPRILFGRPIILIDFIKLNFMLIISLKTYQHLQIN